MNFVALRKCPSCGGELLAFAGVAWMTCHDCPTAWNPFTEPVGSLPTRHPAGEKIEAPVRLPFYVFGSSPAASSGLLWVPAYRESGTRSDDDVASVLTSKPYLVELVEAPLRASLGRGLVEATALCDIRRRREDRRRVTCQALVSLPCRVRGDVLEEPVSGLSLKRANILPRFGTEEAAGSS